MKNLTLLEKVQSVQEWKSALDYNETICGDMPGDNIKIVSGHIEKAKILFPCILHIMKEILSKEPENRMVISVFGGSGVGKTGIAFLLSYYFREIGIGCHVISGDNYPHRIPTYNDAERLRIFRQTAIKGLVQEDEFSADRFKIIKNLQEKEDDANCENEKKYSWISKYISYGRSGLERYLGTENEIDFEEINSVIKDFKKKKEKLYLRKMGRTDTDFWYEEVDFSDIQVLIIDWTHGNSCYLKGVDIPVLLNSTPAETLEHRVQRNRNAKIDHPFTTLVLDIEQNLIKNQASSAKLIMSNQGNIMDYSSYANM